MQEYAVDLLTKILKIYSPTGAEERLSHFLVAELKRLGLHSWRDEVGNAIGEFGSGEPTILLCGHMDTVHVRLPVKLVDGRLYGRGSVDAKASLAAMVVASSRLLREGFPGRVFVVGAVDEEGFGRGVRHLIEKGFKADYAIFGEPSGVECITTAYKGGLLLEVECGTETGHSSAPWLYKNAVEEAFKVYELLRGIHFDQEKPESRFYSISSCVTRIEGGSEFSTVPPKCVLRVNMRIPPTLTVEKVLEEVRRVLKAYQVENVGVDVGLEVLDSTPPYEADKNSLLVRSLAYAIRKVRKKQAVLVKRTGGGDMNIYGLATGVPVVTYGAGDSHLDHTPDEHVVVEEYLDSIEILHEGLKKLREMHISRG